MKSLTALISMQIARLLDSAMTSGEVDPLDMLDAVEQAVRDVLKHRVPGRSPDEKPPAAHGPDEEAPLLRGPDGMTVTILLDGEIGRDVLPLYIAGVAP